MLNCTKHTNPESPKNTIFNTKTLFNFYKNFRDHRTKLKKSSENDFKHGVLVTVSVIKQARTKISIFFMEFTCFQLVTT